MKCFTNDTDTVIADDIEDAWVVWCGHTGELREDYDAEDGWAWEEIPLDKELTIWCDWEGIPDTPDTDGVEEKTKTVAQWIESMGRGFLCSTEY